MTNEKNVLPSLRLHLRNEMSIFNAISQLTYISFKWDTIWKQLCVILMGIYTCGLFRASFNIRHQKTTFAFCFIVGLRFRITETLARNIYKNSEIPMETFEAETFDFQANVIYRIHRIGRCRSITFVRTCALLTIRPICIYKSSRILHIAIQYSIDLWDREQRVKVTRLKS